MVTFVDSYGTKRSIPKCFCLKKRSVAAVLGELLETVQRTKDKYTTQEPLVSLEYIGLELGVSFQTIFLAFRHLEKTGLLKLHSICSNIHPNSLLKTISFYRILRDAREEDQQHGEVSNGARYFQRRQQ